MCSVDWFLQHCTLFDQASPKQQSPKPSDLPTTGDINGPYSLKLQDDAKRGNLSTAKAYIRAYWQTGMPYTDIQFWLFYAYNGPATIHVNLLLADTITATADRTLMPAGEHYGDWECCVLRIDNFTKQLIGVCLLQHGVGEYFNEQQLSRFQRVNGQHIVVYPSLNGHALYSGVGRNYTAHGKKDYVVAGVEWMVRNDTADGGQTLDCSSNHEIISMSWLGEQDFPSPKWVSYPCRWGPKDIPQSDVPLGHIEAIINDLGFSGVPGPIKSKIADAIRDQIKQQFRVDLNGPPGPPWNSQGKTWKGQYQ
ncbi:Vps62-related protein [Trichocoleus sp. DQ-U1]